MLTCRAASSAGRAVATRVDTLALRLGDAFHLALAADLVSKATNTESIPKNARPAAVEVWTCCSMTLQMRTGLRSWPLVRPSDDPEPRQLVEVPPPGHPLSPL